MVCLKQEHSYTFNKRFMLLQTKDIVPWRHNLIALRENACLNVSDNNIHN